MKKLFLFIFFFPLLLWNCSGGASMHEVAGFTDTVYSPRYASGFSITRVPGQESLLISVSNAWQGCDTAASRLLILRNGEKAPTGFSGEVVNGQAKRIVTMSSTNIAMLDAVGESRCVAGVSGLRYITSPGIIARSDMIADVGYEGSMNYEAIVALDPDLVMIYGVDGRSSMEGKLKELKIPYIYIGDYMENHPLGKAEWIVPVAAIVGKMDEGVKFFNLVSTRYEDIKGRIALSASRRPKVLVNAPYSGSWFMPTPESYTGRLVMDAGGELLYDSRYAGVATPVETEAALSLASQADIWLNPGQVFSIEEVRALAPKFSDVPPLRSGRVWNNNLHSTSGGGNDYFESGVVHPDWILSDLIRIFHPESAVDSTFHYYQKLN